jgi:hypothetical protein
MLKMRLERVGEFGFSRLMTARRAASWPLPSART